MMNLETFMYWFPVFLLIIGAFVWNVMVNGVLKTLITLLTIVSIILFFYLWGKYWVDREYGRRE